MFGFTIALSLLLLCLSHTTTSTLLRRTVASHSNSHRSSSIHHLQEIQVILESLVTKVENLPHSFENQMSLPSVANLFSSNSTIVTTTTTLVTHGSISKLPRLIQQLERWQYGPASVALYIQRQSDIKSVINFIETTTAVKDLSIHVIVGNPNMKYPMNLLRNIGLSNTHSDYVLILDGDFLTNENCYQELQQSITNNTNDLTSKLKSKTLFVLPAFEKYTAAELQIDSTEDDEVPATKTELLQAITKGRVAPFHLKRFVAGHGSTDYEKWYRTTDFYYDIMYEYRYEPYVLAYRPGLATFWNGFYGFGFNKGSWATEMHYRGYNFSVLGNHFVTHLNHPRSGNDTRFPSRDMISQYHQFKNYLMKTYGVPKAELSDFYGFA